VEVGNSFETKRSATNMKINNVDNLSKRNKILYEVHLTLVYVIQQNPITLIFLIRGAECKRINKFYNNKKKRESEDALCVHFQHNSVTAIIHWKKINNKTPRTRANLETCQNKAI